MLVWSQQHPNSFAALGKFYFPLCVDGLVSNVNMISKCIKSSKCDLANVLMVRQKVFKN